MFGGEVEADESYFGGRREGRRGRGAGEKIQVFGLLKRGGTVYTKIIPNASSAPPNANHRALDCARQHRLFRQLEGLQRA